MECEQIMKFKKKFNNIATDIFLRKPVYFGSFVIRLCNGMGPCPFNEAWVICENGKNNYPVYLWWENEFSYIVEELPKIDSPEAFKGRTKITKLMDGMVSMWCKHEKCLKQLREDKNLTEEKTKSILALHYFKPLSNDAAYCVDKGFKQCPWCKEDIKADQIETSFGNNSVWHGQFDILVKRSIVKVGNGLDALSIEDYDEDPDKPYCVNVEEDMTKSFHQAIAQTIVNAFIESGKDISLFNKFIPSFIATDKIIRILMYNCKTDQLLISGEFSIWKDDSLDMETMMFVWVAINCLVDDSFDTTKHLIENTAKSKFKDAVGKAYQIYLNDVTRPVTKVRTAESSFNETFYGPFDESEDSSYILKAGWKIFQCVEASCMEDATESPEQLIDND